MMSRSFALSVSGLVLQSSALTKLPERSHDTIRIDNNDAFSFTHYMTQHGKTYSQDSEEFNMRLELFRKRAEQVDFHNSNLDRSWTAAMNQFSDRTDEELASVMGYRHLAIRSRPKRADDLGDLDMGAQIPKAKDWSTWQSLSFIRDQGSCGSCWAVTATTILAAHSEIHGTNRSFSTQQVVDCVPNPHACGGDGGCQGATVELAFQYVMMVGSKEPEEYGAYTARDGQCDFQASESTTPSVGQLTEFGTEAKSFKAGNHAPGRAFGMIGWQKLPENKEQPLLVALATQGPVAVALAASDIMMYGSGIFDSCNDWTLNHAVSLVGYGVEGKKKYWLVQNSWGNFWGEGGRIRIKRTDDEEGNCGTDTDPQAGLACKGDTDPIEVCGTCGILYDSVFPIFKN